MHPLWPLAKEVREHPTEDDPLLSGFIDGSVVRRDERPQAIIKGSGMEAGYKRARRGDLVISGMNAHLGAVGVAQSTGRLSPVYVVLRPLPAVEPRFLANQLRFLGLSGWLINLSKSIRFNSADLSFDKLRQVPIAFPDIYEQRAIADFLDRETSRIDALIVKKRRILDVLGERVRVLISEVVTGRHDVTPTAEFAKIGSRPIGVFTEVQLGRQRTPKDDVGPYMVPYMRAANVKDGALNLTDVKEMNFSPAEQAIFSLSAKDVLVTEGAGSLAAVGASAVWKGEIPGVVCFQNTLIRLRPRSSAMKAEFLYWWARHAFGSGLFAAEATGANIFHLGADRLKTVQVKLPSAEGQTALDSYLAKATARHGELAHRLQRQVALLTEHRQALMTAAVTGQTVIPSAA